ncbi:hypothetical protein ACQKP5_23485 [Pseudomonas vancouverensis]|uniref:hypothetical protein n=1 Tax=Pseudomonas vancouverensis TaxID=95300 RepID=UPI003D0241A0
MKEKHSKSEKTAMAVKILQDLLILIAKRPEQFSSDTNLRLALKSQGSLASLDISYTNNEAVNVNTTPMSLNTLKTYADNALNGGFKVLNVLRIKALDAFQISDKRHIQINKRTKSGLIRKVEQLEIELEMHRRTNYILLQALSSTVNQLVSVRDAPDEKIRAKRTLDSLNIVRAIMSLNSPPFNEIPSATPDTNNAPKPSLVTDINSFRK